MIDKAHADRLRRTAAMVRSGSATPVTEGDLIAGLDLGTADIVFLVLDASGEPVFGALEWAEVVRDGVVVDFVGARRIVRQMVDRAEEALGRKIETCSTGYPPGTDPELSVHVVRDAGMKVGAVLDEPTAAARAVGIQDGIVVDIGGGTTGISVLEGGKVRYSADEATGGRHLSLVIAGGYKIRYEEAEQRKRSKPGRTFVNVVRPVIEKMGAIVKSHIRGVSESLPCILVGGTPQLEGFQEIFEEELGRTVDIPPEPLFATPLGIAIAGMDAHLHPSGPSRPRAKAILAGLI